MVNKFKMNISDKLIKLVNFRIEQEEISSRLYRSMYIWLEFKGYLGAAKLWKKYSEEEMKHSQWAYQYLLDLDVMPEVPALPKPICNCTSLEEVIYKSYEHEQAITQQCQKFAEEAMKDGDYMTMHFAQHYLDEQVEELAKTSNWINRLEAFGNGPAALRLLDNELGEA